MASSSYYYSLMMKYSREKRKIEEKKEKWVAYLEKLNTFNGILPNITSSVSTCNSSLLGGGYLVGDGISLDNGKLNEIIGILDKDCSTLSNIISKTQSKIEEFSNKITELSNLYKEANRNYISAKRQEEMKG